MNLNDLNKGLVYTNSKCIGCHRCISGCPVLGANIAVKTEKGNQIHVNNEKCLHCGRCFTSCHHDAREFHDDTSRFLEDLRQGKPVSLLVAPSFFIIYGDRSGQILGYLKSLGLNLIYDVSYGADIAIWAYLKWLEEHGTGGEIAPPCSAVVNYIEKYSDILSKRLIPVKSPLMCLATYIRKHLKNTDKLAFLTPCIAKKDEIDAPDNAGLVDYNVTFSHLLRELGGVDFSGFSTRVELSDFGLGRLFPVPGGLSENIRHFVSVDHTVREVHGELDVYEYFMNLEKRIQDGKELPFLIDCLNCGQGCFSGPATEQRNAIDEDIFLRLQRNRRPNPQIPTEENPYLQELPLEERRKRLWERFADFDLSDYLCSYRGLEEKYLDERYDGTVSGETYADLEKTFLLMHKTTEASRKINCHACGYSSCIEMATAISKGYNLRENCVHFLKDEMLLISKLDIRNNISNYNAYLEFTEKLLSTGKMTDYVFIYCNINNFKLVNETYGFKEGEKILQECCRYAASLMHEDELMALTGGNNFVGVFHTSRLNEITSALNPIALKVTKKDASQKNLPAIDVSLNTRIAVYHPDGTDTSVHMVTEKLSITLDSIDRTKGQSLLYYNDSIRQRQKKEAKMAVSVAPALKNREFHVYYQPKVNITSHEIVGAEALIRWVRNGEVIPPMEFIPVCERKGIVQKLDFFVLEAVCQDIAAWNAADIPVVTISVNFSKVHFVTDQVADRIHDVIRRHGIDTKYIEVEFTETACIENTKELITSIKKLHDYGIASSMDDFGMKYSTLSMLQKMNFDTLKLDKSFLDNISSEDDRKRAVVKNVIQMAHELDMKIVSEGIETRQELAYIENLNGDIAQGYLFDKPLTRKEFEKRLMQRKYLNHGKGRSPMPAHDGR